jgi:hypothetical protein
MKQDRGALSDDSWRALAVERNIPVLFCQDAGYLIASPSSGLLCANCNIPLKEGSYPIASLACLGHMAQNYGGFRTQTQLTADWGWQPTEESSLFAEHCRA